MTPDIERVVAGKGDAIPPFFRSGEPIAFAVQNLNTAEQPTVYTTTDPKWGNLLLTATNASSEVVQLNSSSVLLVYLDSLLTDDEIGKITIASANWAGGPVNDALGTHLELKPTQPITLLPSQQIQVEVSGALASGVATTGYFVFYYNGFSGVANGNSRIQGFRQAPPTSNLPWPLSFGWGPRDAYNQLSNTVYVTPWPSQAGPEIRNSFVLQIENLQSDAVPLPVGSSPRLIVSFVAGDTLLSLCSDGQLKDVDAAVTQSDVGSTWNIAIDQSGPLPIFIITPAPTNLELFEAGGILAITFSNLVTDLAPNFASPVFIQYAGLPGYNDGYSALPINKTAPVPYVEQFAVTSGGAPVAENETIAYGSVTVSWYVFAAQTCSLQGFPTVFPPVGTQTFTPGGPYPASVSCDLQPQIGPDNFNGAELNFTMAATPPVQVWISANADNPVPGPHGVWNVNCSWGSANATSCQVFASEGLISTALSGNWGTSGMSVPLQFEIVGAGPGGDGATGLLRVPRLTALPVRAPNG
jgi:hypothetical protein